MLTTRIGVWEAESAVKWESICAGVNVGLMQLADADRLFVEQDPALVNEFTRCIMDVTYGRASMERWGVEVGD